MKRSNLWLITLLLLLSFVVAAQKKTVKKPAQKPPVEKPKPSPAKTPPSVSEGEKEVREIVSFLQYMLNTLGSSSTSRRDKDVLITESFSKIFRDGKVQVEDDLDEERDVVTHKDVVAYLKDVDFFFKEVKFEFNIESIKNSTLPNGELFYKVSSRRILSGTNSDGKPVNNSHVRYIEVNYNPKDQDLKIVSIYTNEFNEKEALTSWWKELSYEWQSIFRKKLGLKDSVRLSDIRNITSIKELDLTNNNYIQSLEPLSQLSALQSLNLSGIAITNLTPIRNLTELVELNLSATKINDLTPLRYSIKLEKLNISHTSVSDITVLEKMLQLQALEMGETRVADFTILTNLTALKKADLSGTKISTLSPLENGVQLSELNLSGTPVQDLTPLKGLKQMEELDLDSTRIRQVEALAGLENLKILSINSTSVSDLTPLRKLSNLEKIYCDQTPIKREQADAFMALSPKTLVILDSKDLSVWWGTMTKEWQKTLSTAAGTGPTPSKEELARISLLDSVNISGNALVTSLEPLRKLQKVKVIIANKAGIIDLSPLKGLREISYLDISETPVRDISVLSQFPALKVLKADKSKIENIEQYAFPKLEKLYADQTSVHDIIAREFLEKNPTCLLIYKTSALNRWWNNLPESWKDVFRTVMPPLGNSKNVSENLHRLIELEKLQVKDAQVSNLAALSEFVRLKELHVSGTGISSISPLENIRGLTSLSATNGPITNIDSLDQFTQLEELDISNTPIDDVYVLWRLKKLKKLNCAGTQIKRLDALEALEGLEYFDCSNTNVNKLDPLDYLPLKTLKCYNTKVSTRVIENFKASHPQCNVIYYR